MTENAMLETHAVVITRPGQDTIRFGPIAEGTAGEWAARLNQCLSAHGPEVEVTPFTLGSGPYIHPASIPRNVDDLMEPLRADKGFPGNGGFPDLFDQLIMVHGPSRAIEMWDTACRQGEADAAAEEAETSIAATAGEALDLIAQAATAAQQADQKVRAMLTNAEAFDLAFEGDAYPGTIAAAAHIDAALRELRAAERVLRRQPERKD